MQTFTKRLACALAAVLALPASAKTLTIGIDISRSSPHIISPELARVSAGYVHYQVEQLAIGDIVVVRPFGDHGLANFARKTFVITKANRPHKVAGVVAQFVANLPEKKMEGQNSTHIIAFLEFGQHFDCANGGSIILLTDGMESSSYIDERSLAAGNPLPEPDKNLLAGCDVAMVGFGHTRSGALPPQAIKNARASWVAWMKTAGATFNAVVDP